ncbi:helix-turn-helix domain-containing protein [Streptomyces sp. 8L]|uniref:helix-turn-helix domain-containing protein n=1 Tax=Streptomyces sp. 8L TaxID=2877242 RepID=UPI001CD50295|nr:helix-turn-helix transcriptional regulator [Streptomyces sp. 8L]MCA1222737.1 helix-turn-helix domain-containing protein [Streptomyces sp. 8L]
MGTSDTVEFAAILRELKGRSGLSYGALARRLHVSTSTLHRYCNGDAVPADYAPVERLARLCGASPAEQVDLHRRWIIADEARRRGRAAGAGPVGAETVEAGPVEVTSAGAESAGSVGTGPAGGEPEETEPAATEPAATAGSAPEADIVSGGRAVVVGEDGAGRARGRAAGGRLRWHALAASAVALVAVVAAAFGLRAAWPGTSSDRVSASVPASTSAGRSAAPAPSPPVTGSAHAAPARHTPSAGAASPASGSARPAPPPARATGGSGGTAGGALPLAVRVQPYAFEDPCSQHYLINSPATKVPPPPEQADAQGWVRALGGVASGEQYITLTVQGTGHDTVVLNALHVRVLTSGAPLPWNDYAMGVGCGGGVGVGAFAVDLDQGRPAPKAENGQADLPRKVSEGDPEVFHIKADTSAHDVSWYLELDWSSGTRSGTLRLDDQGRPFRTSGAAGRPAYDYPLGDDNWERAVVNTD